MKATTLNPTQLHLLKLFSRHSSEKYAIEVQDVLTQHFQDLLDKEADRLWEEGILDNKRLNELRHADFHAKK